jgi:hypothetical protein
VLVGAAAAASRAPIATIVDDTAAMITTIANAGATVLMTS